MLVGWSIPLSGASVWSPLCALPVVPEGEKRIKEFAAELVDAASNDYPVSRGDQAAMRSLDTLSKAKVRETLDALPLEAVDALEGTGGYSVASQLTFEEFARRVQAARRRLEAKPVKKLAGRPESRLAAEVSRQALRAYEWLTNKQAGITTSATERGHPCSGEFLSFLAEIFKTLEIKASPVSQAKKALASRDAPWRPDDYTAMQVAIRTALDKGKSPGVAAAIAWMEWRKQKSSRKKRD